MNTIPQPDPQLSWQALKALLTQRTLLASLEVFHAELGDIFQLPVRGFNPVVLAGAEANRFVLVEERDNLRWRSEQDPITRLLRHGVLVEDGEPHDTLRRQMNPALHKSKLPAYLETMWQQTDRVIDRWATTAPLDMGAEMRRVTLLILMETLFGVDFEPEIQRLWGAVLKALHYVSPGLWVVWTNIPRPGYQHALQKLERYLQQIITLRRASGQRDDLLGLLIAADLPDDLIRDQMLTMIIAGHDTSTALLNWVLYVLSRYPNIQAKVQAELGGVLGSNPPDYASLKALAYLDQVINETLRLFPPLSAGLRIAARDLEFCGYSIPAGTRVMYSIYLTHRDPQYWADPTTFLPERFAPEQARLPYTFLPFGGGARNCIGMMFAQVEAKVVLARILQKFDLEFTTRVARPYMGVTLEPRPANRLRVKRRN